MPTTIVPLAEGRFAADMSEDDWREGEASGRARDEENKGHPFRRQTHGAEPWRSLEYSTIGGVGEKGVCELLAVRYGGKGTLGEVDIAGVYEVKASRHPCLLLNGAVPGVHGRPDSPDAIYIACQVMPDQKRVVFLGWAAGRDVMVQENWGDHFRKSRPCFKVDAGHLNPMTTLPRLEQFPESPLFHFASSEGTKDAECPSNQRSPSPLSP